MPKRALITGILGQDGAYLAKLLLEKGYDVLGGTRGSSSLDNTWRLEELGVLDSIRFVPFELFEVTNIIRMIEKFRPDELYNLAAQSFVAQSFEQPILTAEVNGLGPVKILEALRTVHPECRFYQASTSEMFGNALEVPQTEGTPFNPRSPYAAAKLYAHCMTVNYRESYKLHASSGILFNHESPLRGKEFITRKITAGLARVHYGLQETVELGNLDAERDWGFAGDYVRGMWLMLQQSEAHDYVLATGENHSVREFIEKAIEVAGSAIDWEGEADQTRGIDKKSGRTVIRVNPVFYRPAEVDTLLGDAAMAREKMGWAPTMTFDQLVETMMQADLDRIAAQKA